MGAKITAPDWTGRSPVVLLSVAPKPPLEKHLWEKAARTCSNTLSEYELEIVKDEKAKLKFATE